MIAFCEFPILKNKLLSAFSRIEFLNVIAPNWLVPTTKNACPDAILPLGILLFTPLFLAAVPIPPKML